ncbi:MAG: BlaI/MecI/CopY family transcriptional regulator [Rikenellaceae bacterium]
MEKTKIKLTTKEEEVMLHFWKNGPMFVRELQDLYPDPKPHFNTLSTVVRGLQDRGYISYNQYGNTYQYYAVLPLEEFRAQSLSKLVGNYFDNSIFSAVSTLVGSKSLSRKQLEELLKMVESQEEEDKS